MADLFTTNVPGQHRVRVTCRSSSGEFYRRYVWVFVSVPMGEYEIMEKARAAFRRTYGDRPDIVSFDIHCPQTKPLTSRR